MARYRGPRCRLARREKVDLMLTSRPIHKKCHMDHTPGQHYDRRFRASKTGDQLRSKQRVKRTYGMMEKQFRRLYNSASRLPGKKGENMLALLERRLDNTVFRAGFAVTRAEARQLVSHNAILVNNRSCNISSYLVKVGDIIRVKTPQERVLRAITHNQSQKNPSWLHVESKERICTVEGLPRHEDAGQLLQGDLNMMVEFYSIH